MFCHIVRTIKSGSSINVFVLQNILLHSKSYPFYAVVGSADMGPHTAQHRQVVKSCRFSPFLTERASPPVCGMDYACKDSSDVSRKFAEFAIIFTFELPFNQQLRLPHDYPSQDF
jgi:hypothetical protein